ncbi:S-layer homology domain-containing protein [Agathobaculum sp.]|uniref:S-layer homology domain-containing protein n=1 Tax=Agathobaculum sp. TaxID=2048138 RepID=UPI003A92FFCD
MKKKPIKLKQWVSGTLSATVLLSCMNTVVFAAEASPAAVQKPELMVTELVPDTENFTGTDGKASDAYEFIELYNPSETETRNLSEYNLVYYNGTKDYSWSLTGLTQENDITLTPGETLVIWVRNEDVAAVKTVEDFRSHYGLAENVKVAAITAGGMRNSATGTADGCGIRIQKDGAEIARAYYNENKSSQVQPDKAFTFGYGADGSAVLRMLSSAADPTPGTVDADSLLPPTTNPDPEPEPEPSPEPAALLITELLPNSSNMNKADAYEFVEVYNNSNKRINLKDYRLYYNNNLDASDNDVLWASFDKDLYLESGACMVFWIHNGSNDTLTVDDFNKKFGTNLVENQNIIILENGGMSNSAPRGLRITTNVHDEVNYVTYNVGENDANGNDHADKTITYRYDGTKSVKVSNVDTPTPGFIPTDLASVGATLQVPKAEPTVKDNTPETFDNDEGLTFSVTATSDGTTIKTVKLSYKDAKMQNYETYNLTRDGSGDDFKLTLTPADLTAKSSYTYYFTVSDGFKTVTTPVKTTSSTKVSEGDIHFNVTENEWISGTKRIITTGDTLQIGSNTMTAATPSIENKAKFIFEASQTDTFFKNAAAIGSDVLGIFNDGTYGEWKTYAYDVDPAYFTKGQTTTIDIHAGNKSNVLVHDAENNDDFVVRNIRLILPDGTTLRAESYVAELGKDVAEKNDKTYQKNYGVAENIKMGDSKNTVEILHVNFKPEDAAYNGIAYNLDTTKLPDGKVTISGSTGEQSQTVTVRVDNTAPAVQSNIENGQQYKGGNEIRVDVTDSGSGVASQTVKLDGKKITLPYAFASADMTPGSHTLTVTAEDTCGNKTNKNITFTTPEEDPMISQFSPADGLTQSTKPTFSAVATDPTGDSMTVSFKKGESYRLGDSNIQTSSGISNTSGSNTKDFDDGQSGNGFPFEQFDVTVGEQVSPSDDLNVQWTGKTNEAKTFLYAYNTVTGKWDRMDTTVTANEDGTVTLNGIIALTDHLDGRTVKVMVQSGEGYTPTQYAAGASAGTPTYSHITTSNEGDTPRDNYDFTFAVESDTQYYNEDRSNQGGGDPNPIGKYQYQLDIHDWLLANRSRMNIQYLFHDGDIIDDVDLGGEWDNADKAYAYLDRAGFPYGVLAGNHDVGHLRGDYTEYWKYFGASRYENNPWYGGSYQNNRAHYDLITVDGIDFLMMYVGWGVGDEEIEWMNEVLAKYPERVAILNFHEYLLATGGLGEEPKRVYDEVISVNPNVRMVLSGHYHNAKTVTYDFDDNKDGQTDRKVYAMLFDYQGLSEGGKGYMRLMHFDCKNGTVTVRTYSPSLNDYDAKDNNGINSSGVVGPEEFTISFADLGIATKVKQLKTVDLRVNAYGDETIGSVNNVSSGSTASYLWDNASDGTYGWYAEASDSYGGLCRSDVTYLTLNGLPSDSSSGGSGSRDDDDDPSYAVSAPSAKNGDVTVSPKNAAKGDTVTITVTPDSGYKVDKVTVTNANGNTITVTDKGNGKYTFTMPASKVTITPTFVKIAQQPTGKTFSDVAKSDWFADAVAYVTDKGLMSGTGSDKFAPSATTTRAMLMTVLARYAGEDTTGGATWYEKSMEWAKAKGVSDGTNPNADITREQLVTMLYRYAGSPAVNGSLSDFSDAASVSSYAENAMQWAVANGIVNGSNGKLNPQDNATRAEVAAILMRFCEMSK